jgi:hypothetical protein
MELAYNAMYFVTWHVTVEVQYYTTSTKSAIVCPFVRIGSSCPLFRKRVCLPPWNQRGRGQHSLGGEGAGGANLDDWREILALCLLSVHVTIGGHRYFKGCIVIFTKAAQILLVCFLILTLQK